MKEIPQARIMQIAQIMSSPAVSVAPETSLDELMRIMDERRLRHLPVVSDDALVGLVCDRDVLAATGWLPERLREAFLDEPGRPRTAADLVVAPVMIASPEDDVMTLTVETVVQGTGCLPIVEDGRLVGIVTDIDLMRAYRDSCRREPESSLLDTTVEAHMTRSVRAIDVRGDLGEALRMMGELAIHHLPVVQAGNLVGMVSDRDLRRELGRGRKEDYPLTEVMTTATVSVGPRMRLSEAVGRMLDSQVSSLPVLRDDELIGILTSADVLDHCMTHLTAPGTGPG